MKHSGPENLKKSRQKNSWNQINQFFSWNCIFGSFPSSKIDFWPFLKLEKMKFGQKNYSWKWFIRFHEFFGLDFFKFSGPLCQPRTFSLQKNLYFGSLLKYLHLKRTEITFFVYKSSSWIWQLNTTMLIFDQMKKCQIQSQNIHMIFQQFIR